jgi:hypothetical protein
MRPDCYKRQNRFDCIVYCPEGAKRESPGQRPGVGDRLGISEGPTDRNPSTGAIPFRRPRYGPLCLESFWVPTRSPGRCPGLSSWSPAGPAISPLARGKLPLVIPSEDGYACQNGSWAGEQARSASLSMITFDDRRWEHLKGGYKTPCDPRPVLRRLEAGGNGRAEWDQLCDELHHQGDVGEASYASVPHLVRMQAQSRTVDWNLYALVSTIEIERHRHGNPPLPSWLAESYRKAWLRVVEIGTRDLGRTNDPLAVRSILGAIALAKGQLRLGAFIAHSDLSEIDEFLEKRSAWSQFYSEQEDPGGGSPPLC